MGQDNGRVRDRKRLEKEAGAVLKGVLGGGATLVNPPSHLGPGTVAVTAFAESETRSGADLTAAVSTALAGAGWTVQDPERDPAAPAVGPAVYAVLPGLGSGSFAVAPPAISFAGVLEPVAEPQPEPQPQPGPEGGA
ncbi:hypothetical protein ACFWUQ_09690 [Streptomyces sp. NPDC058662]|uniref:hypothetical protein n=1 Tax=Streptomyces sp. NPDC058662 TaxID=3346583 RepID=UPI0036599D6B